VRRNYDFATIRVAPVVEIDEKAAGDFQDSLSGRYRRSLHPEHWWGSVVKKKKMWKGKKGEKRKKGDLRAEFPRKFGSGGGGVGGGVSIWSKKSWTNGIVSPCRSGHRPRRRCRDDDFSLPLVIRYVCGEPSCYHECLQCLVVDSPLARISSEMRFCRTIRRKN